MYPTSDDPKILRAFTHPLRVEIFDRLETRVASPSAIAIDLGEPVATVAYHVRHLLDAGLVRLVDRQPRRGAVEHYYTGNVLPTLTDERWGKVPVLLKRAIIGGALRKLGLQIEAAAAHGTLDGEGAHLSRVAGRVDQHGWAKIANYLRARLEALEAVAAGSKIRLAQDPDRKSRDATVVIMLFNPADPASDPAEPTESAGRNGERSHLRGDVSRPADDAWPGLPPGTREPSPPEPIDITDPRIQKAILHPLRVQLLEALHRRVASPSDIAREIGSPLATTSYHVRQLESLGLVKLVKRMIKRGALEHYYTAAVHPIIKGNGWLGAPDGSVHGALTELGAHVFSAARAGGFDRADIHYSRTTLRLDREGWLEVARALEAMCDQVEETVAESEDRILADSNGTFTDATIATILFERPPLATEELRWDHDPTESLPPHIH